MQTIHPSPAGHRECFGGLFPDLARVRLNAPNTGKVFGVFIESVGIGIQGRELTADETAWDACRQCHEFESCLRLSEAKLAFANAVQSQFAGC